MSCEKYILDDDGNVVSEKDLIKWAIWFEKSVKQRIVKQEVVGKYFVSTVFLGLNHRFGSGQPILWESMVFEKGNSLDQARCCGNREQAEAMHAKMVDRVRRLV